MSIMQTIKIDFKERFVNFETVRGLYLAPAGLLGAYIVIFHFQFILQAAGLIGFIYIAVDGIRKIGVNRIKQAIKEEELKLFHKQNKVNANPSVKIEGH